jgi:uncharacterized protein (UPF0179 family)
MANVTLIGEKQAVKGMEFIYFGSLPECRNCKVKTVCFNLEEGRPYRVIEVRSMHHDCRIYDGGVRAVEFERLTMKIAVDLKDAVQNNTVAYVKELCSYRDCKPTGLKQNEKCKILAVGEDIDCLDGRNLKEVEI